LGVKGTTTPESLRPHIMRATRASSTQLRRWLPLPVGEPAARLTLLGLVIFLQNALEFPRSGVTQVLGQPLSNVLVVLALAGSLALLLAALRERVPAWRWLSSRRVQAAVLAVTLLACLPGIHQVGTALTAGFRPPDYPNDGTTLDHYAAQQVLAGRNPYVTVNIEAATLLYRQNPTHTTPLRCGVFGARPWSSYPSKSELRSAFVAAEAGSSAAQCAFESHVSYPALAFLPLVALVWAGSPSVVPFFALCALVLVFLLLRAAPPGLRPWLLVLALADTPLWDATVGGVLDVFYVLLLFVAWHWWRKPLVSTVFLGLALAAKQLAWFFVPVYALLIWRERGWRAALGRVVGAGAVFAAINLPFFVNNPRAWLAGVLAPQVDPMFPLGSGLVKLSLPGPLPLTPQPVYTALEVLALVGCVAWYWRFGKALPEAGFVLAVLPLFFAWRSLTTYFYFIALPAAALLLARQWREETSAARIVPEPALATPAIERTSAQARVLAPPRRRRRRHIK
jgi:hypothetical protein